MADLVMNSYLSFPGLVELIVPPEVILSYGSLSRPPESCFASPSRRTYSDMVCRFLLPLLSINGDDIAAFWPRYLERRYAHREGELMLSNLNQNHDFGDAGVMFLDILPAFCSISETASSIDMASVDLFRESYVTQEQQLSPEDFLSHTVLQLFSAHVLHGVYSSRILLQHIAVLQQPDIQVLFSSVGCKHACSFKELYLKCLQISGFNQLKHSELASHVAHLLTASYILSFLKNDSRFDSAYCLSKHHDVVYWSSEDEAEYTSLTTASWELDWFCNLLHDLNMVDSVLFFSDNQAALHSLNKLVYHKLLLQQNLRQIILQRQSSMLLVCSGWFMSILGFLYGSLPRPPDIFRISVSVLSNSYGVLHVQDVMAYILRGSIKYDELVYTF